MALYALIQLYNAQQDLCDHYTLCPKKLDHQPIVITLSHNLTNFHNFFTVGKKMLKIDLEIELWILFDSAIRSWFQSRFQWL